MNFLPNRVMVTAFVDVKPILETLGVSGAQCSTSGQEHQHVQNLNLNPGPEMCFIISRKSDVCSGLRRKY